jgi:integrase
MGQQEAGETETCQTKKEKNMTEEKNRGVVSPNAPEGKASTPSVAAAASGVKPKSQTKRVQKHLYRAAYLMANGEWSIYHRAIFRDWKGVGRKFRLHADLKTARKQLTELEVKNFQRHDWDTEKTVLAAQAKAEIDALEKTLTVAQWLPMCRELPEAKTKDKGQLRRSVGNDARMHAPLERNLGDKLLSRLSERDLENYVEIRRTQGIVRWGKETAFKVADGTIRNELASLRRAIRLAKKHGKFVPDPELQFGRVMPEAGTRERLLNDDEQVAFLAAARPWFRRMAIVAAETGLSRSDVMRLTESMIEHDTGVIVPHGGRTKTSVQQICPLTDAVREVLAEVKQERQLSKVQAIGGLIFTRSNGQPITAAMIEREMERVCKEVGINDGVTDRKRRFVFHQFRHMAMTRWHNENVPPKTAMLALGWKSPTQLLRYTNLDASDIARQFGTSKKLARALPVEKKAQVGGDGK